MDIRLQIALIVALIIYFVSIFYMLKKKKLELRYTLLWIFAGVVMVFIALFPQDFSNLVKLLGIIEPTNGLFAVIMFLMLIIFMSMTSILSMLNNKIRTITQKCAMYEKRIRELEKEVHYESKE